MYVKSREKIFHFELNTRGMIQKNQTSQKSQKNQKNQTSQMNQMQI